jgi:hypothetical protein
MTTYRNGVSRAAVRTSAIARSSSTTSRTPAASTVNKVKQEKPSKPFLERFMEVSPSNTSIF